MYQARVDRGFPLTFSLLSIQPLTYMLTTSMISLWTKFSALTVVLFALVDFLSPVVHVTVGALWWKTVADADRQAQYCLSPWMPMMSAS